MKNESDSKASLVEMIQTKQEVRDKFDIYKMDSEQKKEGLVGHKSKPIHVIDKNNAEEFNKFMLACIWEKRIPKNEILLMDLA